MHTTYCDGNDPAEDMVRSAIEAGLKTVGISGHSFTPHDTSYCMSREGTLQYIDELRMLKEKYADEIDVLLGLELDYYADTDTSPYDYFIGSVHYLFSKEGRRKWDDLIAAHASDQDRSGLDKAMERLVRFRDWADVDESADTLARFAEAMQMKDASLSDPLKAEPRLDLMPLAKMYYKTVGDIVRQTDCDIIGHFDLITKFNECFGIGADGTLTDLRDMDAPADPAETGLAKLIDTSDHSYKEAWKAAVDRIFEDCAERYKKGYRNRLEKLGLIEAGDRPVFEINTGAVSRGYRTTPYPAPDQIGYIRSMGGVLIMSSDSHSAKTVRSGSQYRLQ